MTATRALLLATALALLASPLGSTASTRDALIRPGKGIGKVELGMTLDQVSRALGGPPRTLNWQLDLGPRGRYVERGWEIDGSRTVYTWSVGFRSSTRNSKARAVRVRTSVPKQRTRAGLGVGSRTREIVRVHRDAECVFRDFREVPRYSGTWIVVRDDGGMVAFAVGDVSRGGFPEPPPKIEITEVLVQTDWFSPTPEDGIKCLPDWRER